MSENDRNRYEEEADCFMRQKFTESYDNLDPRMQNPRHDPNKNPNQPNTGYKLFVREQMHKIKESE